jgi:hypothetical protein
MAACPPSNRDDLRHLLNATKPARSSRPHDNHYWRNWAHFAVSIGQHPLLPNAQSPSDNVERTMLFLAFVVAMRQGRYSNGHAAKGAEIERALRECAQLMVWEGLCDPRRVAPGTHSLDPSLTNYYKACKRVDPPSKPQQALPSSTVRWIMERFCRSRRSAFKSPLT